MTGLTAAANALNQASGVKAPFNLAFLTDFQRVHNPAIIIDHLPEGAAVIFRDYQITNRDEWGMQLAKRARTNNLLFYVAGDEALAHKCNADGLHLPTYQALRINKKSENLLLSVACHTQEELLTAQRLKADSAFLSPVFPTQSHPNKNHLGSDDFRQMASTCSVPVIALGGVSLDNFMQLKGKNIAGFGAISAFTSSDENPMTKKRDEP